MWKEHVIEYIIIIIIVLLIFYFSRKHQMLERNGIIDGKLVEGNGSIHRKGRGCDKDSTDILLDRITWLSHAYDRSTQWERLIFPTIIAVAIICLAMRKLPSPTLLVMMFIGIFTAFLAFTYYYHTHGDLQTEYYIRKDAQLIRDKLGFKKNEPPESKTDVVPTRVLLNR